MWSLMLTEEEIERVRKEHPHDADEILELAMRNPSVEDVLRLNDRQRRRLYLDRLEAENAGMEVHQARQ